MAEETRPKINTWEFDSLTFLKKMEGQIIKISNKITGQRIEINENTSEVSVFKKDR